MNKFSKEFYYKDISEAIQSKKEIVFEILKENTVYSDNFAKNDWTECSSSLLSKEDIINIFKYTERDDKGYFIRTIVNLPYIGGKVYFKIKDDKTYSVKITWN